MSDKSEKKKQKRKKKEEVSLTPKGMRDIRNYFKASPKADSPQQPEVPKHVKEDEVEPPKKKDRPSDSPDTSSEKKTIEIPKEKAKKKDKVSDLQDPPADEEMEIPEEKTKKKKKKKKSRSESETEEKLSKEDVDTNDKDTTADSLPEDVPKKKTKKKKRTKDKSPDKPKSQDSPAEKVARKGRGKAQQDVKKEKSEEKNKDKRATKKNSLIDGVQRMSTHDLINNPASLKAGFMKFAEDLRSYNVNNRQSLQELKIEEETSSSSSTYTRKLRARPQKKSESESNSDLSLKTFDEDKNGFQLASREHGAMQFEELCRRFDLSKNVDSSTTAAIEDFDLDATGVLMRSTIEAYEKKKRKYDKHSGKILGLDSSTALSQFERIKADIKDIFEDRLKSRRVELFYSEKEKDRRLLRGISISSPFTNEIYMLITRQAKEFLAPQTKDRTEVMMEFIRLVIIPEALIRIYARINKIAFKDAEKEMKYGAQYDGPAVSKIKINDLFEEPSKNRKRTQSDSAKTDGPVKVQAEL